MRDLKNTYIANIRAILVNKSNKARKLALKLRTEYKELKSLIDYGYSKEEAIEILEKISPVLLKRLI